MKSVTIGMGIAAIILGITVLAQRGWEGVLQGSIIGGKMLIALTPMLVLAFAVTGLISVLISKGAVARWLGRDAGWKGYVFGTIAGALVPGGPYVFFPMAATFMVAGAEIGPIISFVTAKGIISVSRLPMEMALVGPKLTVIRYIITFSFPLVLGFVANTIFSGFSGKIRSEIKELQKTNEI